MKKLIIKKKPKKETKQLTCRIESELLKEIREIVIRNNLESINELINECLRFALENKDKEDDDQKE